MADSSFNRLVDLPHNIIKCVIQDQQGFIWIGSFTGLIRYDGYEFTHFGHNPSSLNSLSNDDIECIVETRDGKLWIGTGNGLNQFDPITHQFTHYHHDPDDPNSINDKWIRALFEDSHGILWVGTSNGLDRFDSTQNTITHYTHDPENPNSLSSDEIVTIKEDDTGSIWVGTEQGLNRLDSATGAFDRYLSKPDNPQSLCNNTITGLQMDSKGKLWVGTSEGLDQFDPESGIFSHVLNEHVITGISMDSNHRIWATGENQIKFFSTESSTFENIATLKELSPFVIEQLFIDRSGTFWCATSGRGLYKGQAKQSMFQHYTHDNLNENSLSHPSIRGFYEDHEGFLWIGGYNGLNRLDRKTGKVRRYTHENSAISASAIFCIYANPELDGDFLWIGTEENGLFHFHRSTGEVENFQHQPDTPNSIRDNFVYAFAEDRQGNLWIGTETGLSRYQRNTKTFSQHGPEVRVQSILEDVNGYIWFGSSLNGLYRLSPKLDQIDHFQHDPLYPESISNDQIKCIYQDSSGRIWIGTRTGGLNQYHPDTDTFTHYTEQDGLPDNTVYGILEDEDGFLWMSSNQGIFQFNPEQVTIRNFNQQDGLQGDEFNTGSYYKNRRGEMFFGGLNGFNIFKPSFIPETREEPPLVFTGMKKFDRPVSLDRELYDMDSVTIDHNDYVVTFSFSVLDYTDPTRNKYAYKLEGAIENWIDIGSNHEVTLTNLDPGQYTLHVKGANKDGAWNEAGARLRITMLPPWWKTWWFRGLLALAVTLTLFGLHSWKLKIIQTQNRNLEIQIKERTKALLNSKEQAEAANRSKNDFLSRMSHELRTPLSSIIGFSKLLQLKGPTSQWEQNVNRINKAGHHLLELVNDVLNISAIENGRLEIQPQKLRVHDSINNIVNLMFPIAKEHDVSIVVNEADNPDLMLKADPKLLHQVLLNLVSNGIKYNRQHGKLIISVSENDTHQVVIQFEDSGPGIPPDKLDRLFNPFDRLGIEAHKQIEGTGLGLTLSKKNTEAMNGQLDGKNGPNGAIFTITLPKAT